MESSIYFLIFQGRNRITSSYGARVLNGRSDFHPGLDIVGDDDTHVRAVIGGYVKSSTIITNHSDLTWQWGNYVKVHGDDGLDWFYCHLASRSVKVGQRVEAGTILGIMGNTGYSFGSHTHLEVRNSKKQSLNPCEYLGIPNMANVTYDTAKITASVMVSFLCIVSSYRWRTGVGTGNPLYTDRNGLVQHCLVGTTYRVYDIRKDDSGTLWCQITPPKSCTLNDPPELWVSSECLEMPLEPVPDPTLTPEEQPKPAPEKKEVDWDSPCNEFVVSVTGADRVRLRQLCEELQLHVENLY